MQTTDNKYIPQIDSLRALAVVSVIIYHLNSEWLSGGFSGVDVFFVISGYVVSASLANNSQRQFFKFISFFYAKRLVRILPALLVCLSFTSLLTALFIPRSWLGGSTSSTIILAFFGLSNFSLMRNGDSYFAPRSDFNPATHTWSLGVEEQFYLVLPLIFFVLASNYSGKKIYKLSKYFLPFLVLISFLYSAYVSYFKPAEAYYSVLSRFWELGFGALLFQRHHAESVGESSSKFVGHSCAIGLTLIFFGLALSDKSAFPFPWALFTTVGTVIYIDAVVRPSANSSRLVAACAWWPLPVLGKLSYSLYLWHWPVFVLFRWTVGLNEAPSQVLGVLVAFILSVLSYKFVETPIRYSKLSYTLPKVRIVTLFLSTAAISSALSGVFLIAQPYISLSVTRDKNVWTSDAWVQKDIVGSAGCSVGRTEKSFGDGVYIGFEHQNCQERTERPTLFVIGDSHATALTRLVSKYAVIEGSNAYIYTKLGCGFLSINEPTPARCVDFYALVTDELRKSAKPGDFVLLPSLRLRRLGDQWSRFDEHSAVEKMLGAGAKDARAAGLAEAKSWIQGLKDKDLQFIFLAPTPILKSPPFRCSDWFNAMNAICRDGLSIDREFLQTYRRPVMEAMNLLARENANVDIWDPFDVLCPDRVCKSSLDGNTLFFDADHLSGYGNEFIYESFRVFRSKYRSRLGRNAQISRAGT